MDRLLLGTKLRVPEKSIGGFLRSTGVDIASGSHVTIGLGETSGIRMETGYRGRRVTTFFGVNSEAKRKVSALYSLLSEDKPYTNRRYPGLTVTRAPDSEDSGASGRTTQQKILILERLPHESSGTRRKKEIEKGSDG